ncbi:MAG: U32 family peptidase [Oscillospiraceae bacterium]|nr:U32 family peptidase [Oscillospiraceae bacterium]
MACELLSPAGDMEKLKAAVRFGADAVYCGGPGLHLRSSAAAFDRETLAEGIDYVHARGKKIYVALNAFARNDEIDALPEYIRFLSSAGADAVIVSDLGVLSELRRWAPELPAHISTQANCTNYASARRWYELGAQRVILARELSVEEIKKLRDCTPPQLELEAFVHGAMCMAYSGRCLISAYLAGRDSNRGDCAQPCRWNYRLEEEKRPGEYYEIIEEDGRGTAILSSRDLCALELIDELKAAGICSFKIEGRMKSPYYVATVTNAYRHALDGTADTETLMKELSCASHREYSTGFYHGGIKNEPPAHDGYMQDCIFAAVVKEGRRGELYELEQRNRFGLGQRLELLSPNSLGESFELRYMEDEDGERTGEAVHPMQRVYVRSPLKLSEGDMLRIRLQ